MVDHLRGLGEECRKLAPYVKNVECSLLFSAKIPCFSHKKKMGVPFNQLDLIIDQQPKNRVYHLVMTNIAMENL